jgi:hypothetical protein
MTSRTSEPLANPTAVAFNGQVSFCKIRGQGAAEICEAAHKKAACGSGTRGRLERREAGWEFPLNS